MLQNTRRNFLLASAAAALAGISRRTAGAETLTPRATSLTSGEPYARQAFEPQTSNVAWKLGMIIGVGNDPEKALATVHRLGLPTCQLEMSTFTPEQIGRASCRERV